MEQLLAHIFGDFVLQSDYLALNKSKRSWPCLVHVLIYTSVFLFLTFSWKALLVIGVTHFLLDRFHTPLKRLIWWRNHLNPTLSYAPFKTNCDTTGYFDAYPLIHTEPIMDKRGGLHTQRLAFITMWLYIIHDNFLHLLINFLALKYLV